MPQSIVHSIYRRPLPNGLVAFASPAGRALFKEALAEGTLESYFVLAEQHHTQADPAFCGLASLVVVLNALAIDPGRLWKGPWRWFSEELLDCCVPLPQVQSKGLTADELACLAGCNGARATLRRAESSSLDELRAALVRSSRSASGPLLIASYSRAVLGQSGGGHFSPLAGYHEGRDLALILDVARFKYSPHWVPLELLHRAMLSQDSETGRSRGYIELERAPAPRNLAFVFTHREGGWQRIARLLGGALHSLLDSERPSTVAAALELTLRAASDGGRGITLRETTDDEHRSAVETVLAELRATALYQQVRALNTDLLPELATTLIYLVPPSDWQALPNPLASELASLTDVSMLPDPLRSDLNTLRSQLAELLRCRTPP